MGAWFEKFALSLAVTIIERLAKKIAEEVKEAADLAAQTKHDLELGEKNAAAYRNAKTREERIQRALNLLNSVPSSVPTSPEVSN